MNRFHHGSDAAFAELEGKAKAAAYVQFRDAQLPPGCVPPHARIGIKVDAATGACILYVDRGIRYYGPDQTARRWFEQGELLFRTFAALRAWLTDDLRRLFDTPVNIEVPPGEASEGQLPSGTRATEALSSPGAAPTLPVPVQEPLTRTTPPPPAAGSPVDVPSAADPVAARLVALVIHQVATKHGVDVRAVDPVLVAHLAERIRGASPADDPETIIGDVVGGALSLAALEGRAAVTIHAGPPITCTPVA